LRQVSSPDLDDDFGWVAAEHEPANNTFDLARLGVALALDDLAREDDVFEVQEKPDISQEIGVRLGQNSEFALLIAVLAAESKFVGGDISYLVQITTLITFIISSYVIVLRYPTPIAVSDRLRRD